MKKHKSILSENQKLFLSLFSQNEELKDTFYLTGGTALIKFYIPYRYSEDLDLFSEREVDTNLITTYLKSVKKDLNYKKLDINTSFNRNIVMLKFTKDVLKLEFTYFPFTQIETPNVRDGIKIDSILDISVNKLFTIYQVPRSRDFMDLYMVCKKYKYTIEKLIKLAKTKFDWHVDPIKLGSQFLLADALKDYPKLIRPLKHRDWQAFFEKEAKKLSKNIFN